MLELKNNYYNELSLVEETRHQENSNYNLLQQMERKNSAQVLEIACKTA